MPQRGKFFWWAVALAIGGCVTPNPGVVTLKTQDLSLAELKIIVRQTLPLGIRAISPNGREFTSEVFIIQKGEYTSASEAGTRYWARILVLNDARPYDVEIEVRREIRDERNGRVRYLNAGNVVDLAKQLRTQLKERLAKRREEMNVIDDFRVF